MYDIKKIVTVVALFFVFPIQAAWCAPEIPVKDTVTMVDLGSTTCVPCKLMEPILKELRQEYKGRVEILFVDVFKQRDTARRFGIRAIPTQIFFDVAGKETWRHAGFLEKKIIKQKLDVLLQ